MTYTTTIYSTTIYSTNTPDDTNVSWVIFLIYLMASMSVSCIVFHIFILIYGRIYSNHPNIREFTFLGSAIIHYYSYFVPIREVRLRQRIINRRNYIKKNVVKVIHPTNIESTPQMNCSICLQEITSKFGLVKCGHKFHDTCILTWLVDEYKSTCPICRRDVVSEYSEESVV